METSDRGMNERMKFLEQAKGKARKEFEQMIKESRIGELDSGLITMMRETFINGYVSGINFLLKEATGDYGNNSTGK